MMRTQLEVPPGHPARPAGPPRCTTAPRVGITVYGCDPDESAMFQEMAPRFGAIPTITPAPADEGTIDLASGNTCISVGHKTNLTNATLAGLSRAGVKYISTRSVGCNHIDLAFARTLDLTVETVRYSPDSVADFTLMLMLMAVRQAKLTLRRVDAHDYRPLETRGSELRDLTVGVVGTGRIGAAVVQRLAGFGCTVLAHDRRAKVRGLTYLPLDELLAISDVITLHPPLHAATHHLLDRARIQRLKPGAFVINTGRGALIDTDALATAVESGRLGGAALDVVEGEEGIFYTDRTGDPVTGPLARLQRLPNVLITPHIAYHTEHALRDIVENSLSNCVTFAGRTEDPWVA